MAELDPIHRYLRLPLKVASEVISAPEVIAPVFSAMLADYSKDAKSAVAKSLELFRSRLRHETTDLDGLTPVDMWEHLGRERWYLEIGSPR